MKKIFITIILFLISIFTQNVFAEDVFKITAANFDTSNSLIVLNIPDESEKPVLDEIKLFEMENPRRAYFDIPSSILIIPKQDWNFNCKGITRVRINQFTTNPNTVRVVIYYDDDFNPSDLKFIRIKNNLIIKLKNPEWSDNYFHRTYRDEHASASDFYEYLTVEVPDDTPKESIADQIHQAFNTTVQQTPKMDSEPRVKKDLKLNTKYYISQITPRPNGVLLSGFGSVTIEKPMILQNPQRIVYDIPNTLVNRDIRNSEYRINETDKVKIGQFEVNKARIVITTPDVTKYIPVYSTDNQSLLLARLDKLNHTSLFNNTSDIISYNREKNDSRTSSMILSFNHPIVHGIDRNNSRLVIYLYNVARYNEDNYNTTYKNTAFENSNLTLLPQVGMKLVIPTEPDTLVNTYLGTDSKTLKVQITLPKKTKPPVTSHGTRKIVIDPGHGGTDVGAIRGDIDEKSITLDVSKRVCEILQKKGYTVEMTRDTDKTVSLQDRVAFSEERKPDIFVSIHVNSSEKPEITGIETHYYRQESLSLAQTVHASLASNIDSNNRGLFKSKFYVINHTTCPAILVEIGFISNDSERAELVSSKRKQATAKAIAEGVENYFKNNK